MKNIKDSDEFASPIARRVEDRIIDGVLIVVATVGFAFIIYELLNF